jgi:hypothetical protein
LSVICEMIFLSLVSQWLDNNYQIQSKVLQKSNPKKIRELNKALVNKGSLNTYVSRHMLDLDT